VQQNLRLREWTTSQQIQGSLRGSPCKLHVYMGSGHWFHRGIKCIHAYSQSPADFRPTRRHPLVQISGHNHFMGFSCSSCSGSSQYLVYVICRLNRTFTNGLNTHFPAIDHPYFTAFILLDICIHPGIILQPLQWTGTTALYMCLLIWRLVKALGRFVLFILGFKRDAVEIGTCLI